MFAMRNPGDPVHEGHGFVIILEIESFDDLLALQLPPRQIAQQQYIALAESASRNTNANTSSVTIGLLICEGSAAVG